MPAVNAEEVALVNLALAHAVRHGLVPMIPPVLVQPAAMEGTGFLGQAAENVYRLDQDDMYLVGTAEVPLAAYHSGEILDAASLQPIFDVDAHERDLRALSFSPDGKHLVTGGADEKIRVLLLDDVGLPGQTPRLPLGEPLLVAATDLLPRAEVVGPQGSHYWQLAESPQTLQL